MLNTTILIKLKTNYFYGDPYNKNRLEREQYF